MYFLVLLSALLVCAAGVSLGTTKPKLDGRIVGGESTDISTHPYKVSVLLWGRYRCSGSIISENWVLTLAYCVDGYKPRDFIVVAGSNHPNSGGTIHSVTSTIVHENFNCSNWDYDVALMQVSPAFSFCHTVQPINLECNPVHEGWNAVVTGYGYSPEFHDFSTSLRQVSSGISSESECNRAYANFGGITDSMICAGNFFWGRGACSGDFGGSLVFPDFWWGSHRLIGIYNIGIACGDPELPDLYTRVSAVCDWIVVKSGLYKQFFNINWKKAIAGNPGNATDIQSKLPNN